PPGRRAAGAAQPVRPVDPDDRTPRPAGRAGVRLRLRPQLRAHAHRRAPSRRATPSRGGRRIPRRGSARGRTRGGEARDKEEARLMALLEVRGLRVGYGELPVLQGIDFDIEAGSRTVLLGLNGAGKTTTVATIAGLLKPWAGTITFDGERIDGKDPAVLVERGISLVPEGRRTFPALS